ncbi:histidinol-phosphate transaminase [Kiritimatiella glycovorans]|uniref:Histidinol-phosphate aminotransferase n=1 Tax=Kiritimatiella glycovorans TaxID=1307763 RepID=A0A0G3EHF6_9BACT|nr:histidinol-phosphate transaminase [Kiritimatiella glycovorans]AKJ64275.1 Histidinol-phosphate aminotransferase 2 [Kiritimatiella glycovorans]
MEPIWNEWVENLKVYEPGRPITEVARELGFDDVEDFLKLASNENELGPSPKAVEAIRNQAAGVYRYPDGGCFYLKRKLAAKLDLTPEHLLFGNGSNELIVFLGHVFLGPGLNLVTGECAFAVYRLVAALYRAGVVAAPMPDLTYDLDALLEAVTPDTRLVAVCNPNNPTGTAVGQEDLDRFIERLPGHCLAVFDEAYIEMMPEDRRPDLMRYVREGRENVLVLRTFSKAYGLAGLRIGYAAAAPAVIGLLNRVRQPFNVNVLAQAAAEAALDDDAHVERTRTLAAEGCRTVAAALAELGCETVPSVANFMLVRVGDGGKVFEQLQRRRIIVRPMGAYGLPDYVRVTVGTPEQNERLIEAFREISE